MAFLPDLAGGRRAAAAALAAAVLGCLAAPCRAQAANPDPEPGPLGEFLQVLRDEEVVITAAKRRQRFEQAPSIMTVLTAEDIRNRGYRTLGEALRDVVGFEINDNLHWPDTGVRGVNPQTSYGEKILMLLDGHNMSWRQFNRNLHNASWVSMDDVQRIEILRGPGSALWGQGALLGVVNIITRDPKKPGPSLVRYGGGTGKLQSLGLRAAAGAGDGEAGGFASYSYLNEDRARLVAPIREFQALGGPRYFNPTARTRSDNFYGRLAYKNLSLKAHASRYDPISPLSTFSNVGGDDSRFSTERQFVELEADQPVGRGLSLGLKLSYDGYVFRDGAQYEANPFNDITETGKAGGLTDPVTEAAGLRFVRKMAAEDRRYELAAKLEWDALPDVLHATLGADLERLHVVRWHFPELWAARGWAKPRYTNDLYAAYGQLEYAWARSARFTAGFRYDVDQRYDQVLSPRLGAIFDLSRGFYAKALYGQAFKSPSFHDLYYHRKNSFYGNPGIKPERSRTYEVQLGWAEAGTLRTELTLFHMEIKDLIAYVSRPAGTDLRGAEAFPSSELPTAAFSKKANEGRAKTRGVEWTLEAGLHRTLGVGLHATARKPEDQDGRRLDYSSELEAGMSLNYRPRPAWNLNLTGLYVGDRKAPASGYADGGAPVSWTAANDPTREAPGYFVAHATARLRPARWRGLELGLRLRNIFNKTYYDAGKVVLFPQPRLQAEAWAAYEFSLPPVTAGP